MYVLRPGRVLGGGGGGLTAGQSVRRCTGRAGGGGGGQPSREAPCPRRPCLGPCPARGRHSAPGEGEGVQAPSHPRSGKEDLVNRACADLVQSRQGGFATRGSGRTHSGAARLTHSESETSHLPSMGASARSERSGGLSLY